MDTIDRFLTDHATPERRDLLMNTYNQLVTLGHVDHEIKIENFVSIQGDIDNSSIVMLIENELLGACHDISLKYFVVCRKEDKLSPYLKLLEFLDYLENTIESDTLIYHHNDELDARDQLLSWVDVFRNDLSTDISDLVLDVMDSLINNLLEIHELKVNIVPVEHDHLFHVKIKCLKALRDLTNRNLLAVLLIKGNQIKSTLSIPELARLFNKSVYALDTDVSDTALNIVSLAVMSPNDVGSLGHDAKTLTNLLYDDVKKTNLLVTQIDQIIDQSGELCKIMNTI